MSRQTSNRASCLAKAMAIVDRCGLRLMYAFLIGFQPLVAIGVLSRSF
jgi:hypothetical protein